MGMYLVLNVWQSATGGVPVLNESKLSEGSIKGIFKNGTYTNQWKQIEKKHKYFSPKKIKEVYKLFFGVIKKESYSEELDTFLTLGSTQATTPNLNTNNSTDNAFDTNFSNTNNSNRSIDSNSTNSYKNDASKKYNIVNNRNPLIPRYRNKGKPCSFCNAKAYDLCKSQEDCRADKEDVFVEKVKNPKS